MTIAEQITRAKSDYDEVYNAGYTKGKSEGGEDNYYDEFWNLYQDNGTRKDYNRAFGGVGWTDTTFKPKYDISPENAGGLFAFSKITNLKKLLEDLGIELDFSKVTYGRFTQLLMDSTVTDIGVVDASRYETADYLFYNATKLVNVEKLIITDTGKFTFPNSVFQNAKSLKEIRFEGVIGKSINFKDCPLSVDSMIDIINHLKSNWADGGSLTQTLTFSGTCWDALENSGRMPDDANENFTTWRDYLESNKGWITA
jgi:hypothetical protein